MRLGDPHFGAGDFGGVAADEMVHRLLRREFADRGQNTESVAGEQDDVAGMSAHARGLGVGDKLDGVGSACIFRNGRVVVIDLTRVGIHNDVFQHRSETDRGKDGRFLFGGQVNCFGVTAPFDIENAVVGPAMFVVSDQGSFGIGGQSGFTCPGQPEEQRNVALGSFVGATVHRKHADFGHQIVHDREDALFHFTGVLRAQEHKFAILETESDTRLGGHAFNLGIGVSGAAVIDDEIGLAEVGQLLRCGADQHVVHKQRMIRLATDHSHLQLMLRIPAGVTIEHVEVFTGIQILDCHSAELRKAVMLELNVDVAPPNIFTRLRILDDAFVLGTATGLLAGECC